ncbi:YkgJ family cysteine cluster protein [Singulisphaera rosea]
MSLPIIRREDLEPGDCLCNHCTGKCCRYFSLPINTPVNRKHYDRIIRYLSHGETLVYVEKGTWYLVVMTVCKYLANDNRCKVYFDRPKVCREYTTAECEYDTDWSFEKVFETVEQLREYAEALLPAPRTVRGVEREVESAGDPSGPMTIAIEAPKTWDDFDAVRWYLAHLRTYVTVKGGQWTLFVKGKEGTRPADPGVHHAQKTFETSEQLWEYAEAVLPARLTRRRKGAAIPDVTLG